VAFVNREFIINNHNLSFTTLPNKIFPNKIAKNLNAYNFS